MLGLVVALAVLGMLDGWYLTMVHVDYELSPDSQLRKVCGALAANGCAVTTGRFGDVAGIPVSVIGLGGATATAITAAVAWRRRGQPRDPWRSTTLCLAAISVIASMVMATLSSIEGSFCPFCVGWYGINLVMALCAYTAWRYGPSTSVRRLVGDAMGAPGATAIIALSVGLSLGYLGYAQRRSATLTTLAQETLDRILADDRPVALDLEGLPSIGPADAPLTVVEIADFECPFCRSMWEGISDYIDQSSFGVRVVFVHFPIDSSCNPGVNGLHPSACAAAQAAQCAHRHDAFFEYGDLLFENQPMFGTEDLVAYAKQLGLPEDEFRACLDDDQSALEVRQSIARGRDLGIQTTPTFFVNGYKFRGDREPKWIRLVFNGLALRAEQAAG